MTRVKALTQVLQCPHPALVRGSAPNVVEKSQPHDNTGAMWTWYHGAWGRGTLSSKNEGSGKASWRRG